MAIAYTINNTQGLSVGVIPPTGENMLISDLRIYGMGHLLWGEGVDENQFRLTENFACPEKPDIPSAPRFPQDDTDLGQGNGINNPLNGQLWYNTTQSKIFVYDLPFNTWRPLATVNNGVLPPPMPQIGDLWYDPSVPQLKVWSGIAWVSVADRYVLRSGDTMTGDLIMSGALTQITLPNVPLIGTDAANKDYVDNTTLSSIGSDAMTAGFLTLFQDPMLPLHAATKQYVDNTTVSITGDTMTGFLTLNAHPVNTFHAATKGYVDSKAVPRNTLINGNFNIWQRGLSFFTSTSRYTADRWRINVNSHGGWLVQRVVDFATAQFPFCLDFNCTAGGGAPAAGDFAQCSYFVEGYDIQPIFGTPFTVSFWVKSNVIGQYYFAVDNITDRNYVIPYTISVANTWEYKTLSVTVSPAASGGTWNVQGGKGMHLQWSLGQGINFNTGTFNSWIAGGAIADQGSDQVNVGGTTGNYWRISGVQLEPGLVASAFEGRSFQEEVALCQRYYEKTYDLFTNPGTLTAAGSIQSHTDEPTSPTLHNNGWPFAVRKRAVPIMTAYSHTSSTPHRVNSDGPDFSGNPHNHAVDAYNASESGLSTLELVTSFSATGNTVWVVQYTADAELV